MLKPPEEMQIAALTAALVYGTYQLYAPNLADVRATEAGGQNSQHIHGSVKTAAWTAAVFTAGIALLSKSPTIFVVGGAMDVILAWSYYHANAISPHDGKVPAGTGQQGM